MLLQYSSCCYSTEQDVAVQDRVLQYKTGCHGTGHGITIMTGWYSIGQGVQYRTYYNITGHFRTICYSTGQDVTIEDRVSRLTVQERLLQYRTGCYISGQFVTV